MRPAPSAARRRPRPLLAPRASAHAAQTDAWLRTAGWGFLITVLAIAVALTNQVFFDAVNRWIAATGPLARGAIYSSYLLLLALPVISRNPAGYGLGLADAPRRWRLVLGVTVGMAALTAAVLTLVRATPYADANWVSEVVIVPLTEELFFRAVLLTWLLSALRRLHPPRTAAALAVAINAGAFAVAHSANLLSLPASFVLPQVAYAAVVGLVAATAMLKTSSVYPAILVHAAVNAVVVAF